MTFFTINIRFLNQNKLLVILGMTEMLIQFIFYKLQVGEKERQLKIYIII